MTEHGPPFYSISGGALKKAIIEDILGEVLLKKESDPANRKAALKDTIADKDVIHTGKKSRAELEFSDKSICRLGSNTVFSFDPASRDMAISRGVAMIHVPPGKGGARIATPAATAAISGDTLVRRSRGEGGCGRQFCGDSGSNRTDADRTCANR